MTVSLFLLVIAISAATSLIVSINISKFFLNEAEKGMESIAETAKKSMDSLYETFVECINKEV